eukprot:augustus_masked-scaffold_19-processed-gene-0.32-mRNA-1 protein AED:1.00 eAED:1.00 QI:0/-1/0/0/-1/1/1/0/184
MKPERSLYATSSYTESQTNTNAYTEMSEPNYEAASAHSGESGSDLTHAANQLFRDVHNSVTTAKPQFSFPQPYTDDVYDKTLEDFEQNPGSKKVDNVSVSSFKVRGFGFKSFSVVIVLFAFVIVFAYWGANVRSYKAPVTTTQTPTFLPSSSPSGAPSPSPSGAPSPFPTTLPPVLVPPILTRL